MLVPPFLRTATHWLLPTLAALLLAACLPSPDPVYRVTLNTDGASLAIDTSPDVTVSDVIRQAGTALGELDRVNPPGFTRVTDGMAITIVRVSEETVVLQEPVAFERQTMLNSSLNAGETRLLQAGVTGAAEVTYRITYEDGVETARSEIRRVLLASPQDEVIMVGSQSTLSTVTVGGALAYISGGNAFIARQNSANILPLTLDGGLDGRVFALAHSGSALLFTRTLLDAPEEDAQATPAAETGDLPFNTLWAHFDTTDPEASAVRLDLDNVLYAEWVPGSEQVIFYSTAEPRPSFPGWQANNDLWRARVTPSGAVVERKLLLEPSSGGIYGWYGTAFAFAPQGYRLAWAQPDAVGLLEPVFEEDDGAVDERTGEETPVPDSEPTEDESAGPLSAEEAIARGLPDAYVRDTRLTFAPRNAYDFVWVPSFSWSPTGEQLIAVTHGAPLGAEAPEDSPVFDLTSFPVDDTYSAALVPQSGMWALPQFSSPGPINEEVGDPLVAFLQAVNPLDSVVSPYRLMIMDRDGSNRRVLFPAEGQPGLLPRNLSLQPFAWAPDGRQIALIYQGNIYLIDVMTGLSQQVTGDGLVTNVRWSP
ncbi:MAG: G5 domain-containing protein [Anaerolineae bacterium]|nr:G5 domain-containing protein [Anaerolineae bacterium]